MNRDKLIGQRLAHYRGAMSQAELAAHMKDLGWKWSQSTVWSIERGDRPLRLAEAEDLLPILDLVSVAQLTSSTADIDLSQLRQRVRNARESAVRAIHVYNHARLDLAFAADEELIQDDPVEWVKSLIIEVGMGPIELAEYYERWAVNPTEGDVPKDRETSHAKWQEGIPDPFAKLFFGTSGYRGDRGEH